MSRLRRLMSVWILLLACLPAAWAEDGAQDDAQDDAAARELDRAALLREAERKVGVRPHEQGEAAIDSLLRKLVEDMEFFAAYPSDATPEEKGLLLEFEQTLYERTLLLGMPASGEGDTAEPATPGAIQEARTLYGWLVGDHPCDTWIQKAGKPFTEDAGARWYGYPPPKPKPEPEPKPEPDPAAEGELGAAPSGPPPAVDDGAETKEGEAEAKPEEPEPEPVPEDEPPPEAESRTTVEKIQDWARQIVLPAEQDTLLGKILAPAKCGTAASLERAARTPPRYRHPEVQNLTRFALLSENVFAYDLPYVVLRVIQADQRNKAMQEDQAPATFVSDAMVQEKKEATDAYRKELDLRRAQSKHVIEQLDEMVAAVDGWKEQGALLLQEIEELKSRLEPPKEPEPAETPGEGDSGSLGEDDPKEPPAPPPPPPDPVLSLKLRLAQARESITNLDLTLVYLTAVRAKARLALLDDLARAAEEETSAAAQTSTRYQERLTDLRNERRMDRILSAERRLRRWAGTAREPPPPDGSLEARRLAAYEALLEVYEVVEQAVATRQRVTSRGSRETRAAPAATAATTSKSTKVDGAARPTLENGVARGLSDIVYEPASATWDVKYVEIARRELEDTELGALFDADLIAAHHASVDDQIRGLLSSMESIGQDAELEPRFEAAVAKADGALQSLGRDRVTIHPRGGKNLPELLRAAKDDFKAAKEGLLEDRERNRERLEALLDYRKLLRAQGARSLLIRTDRDLADTDVQGAVADATAAIRKATRWATAGEEDHAGLWVRRAWAQILGLLVLIAAVIFLVKRGRRMLDARIEVAAASHPALRDGGASVKDEHAEAKRRRVEEEEAKVEVSEADVLRQVTPEAAAVSAPPPEEETKEESEGGLCADEDKKEEPR